jgi:hypothetical protein
MKIVEALKGIPDHRGRQGREYPLQGLLSLIVVGILSGRKGLRAIARYGHDYPEVLPHLGFSPDKPYLLAHTTLSRMLEGLNLKALRKVLQQELKLREGQTLVLDGKKLLGSRGDEAAVHILEAFIAQTKQIVGSVRVKGDEASQVEQLLEALGLDSLKGLVVSGDAAFAERPVAASILKKGGTTSSS